MKKVPWIVKLICAGIAAFIVLNVFSWFYYNVPARTADPEGVSEYKWPANAFHSQMTEGFGQGRVNNDGYNVTYDLADDMDIDVIFMGSSHIEGFNVGPDENAAAVLDEISDKRVYNIAISEHTMLKCIASLDAALAKYHPRDYVVIETMTVSFYDSEIENALNGEGKLPTYSGGIMDVLQKMKYLKLVYYQYSNLKDHSVKGSEPLNNEELIGKVLDKAKDSCDKRNVRLIIVFHPTLSVDNDGSISTSFSREDEAVLRKLCEERGIIFINLEDTFIKHYQTSHELPHGFNNTVPGQGHLNKTGHRLMAIKIKEVMEGDTNGVQ